jgi:hypothetical protein
MAVLGHGVGTEVCSLPRRRLTHIESTLPPATLESPDNKHRKGAAAMKEQAIQYVALDVHQATLVVSVRDEQGSIVMRARVATETKAIVGLVRGLGARVHITFEEGTQARWLHDVLTRHAERVVVCNTRGRGELGNKSDRVDADRLSELLRLGALKPVYHGARRESQIEPWSTSSRRSTSRLDSSHQGSTGEHRL